jgi:hypothetical protein
MSDYNYTEYELVIEGEDYFVTYNLPKDRMTVKPIYDIDIMGDAEAPVIIVAEGFEDFCKDNNYLVIGFRNWSYELDGYDESENEITMATFISEWDVEKAIKDFLTTNYKEQLTSKQ